MSKLHPTTPEDGDDASAGSTTTSSPTLSPTVSPTLAPTLSPSLSPTLAPTLAPTSAPTVSRIVVSGVRGPALWDVAKADCEADGMQLPVIRSQADNDDLVAAAAGVKLWLGATDEDVEGELARYSSLRLVLTPRFVLPLVAQVLGLGLTEPTLKAATKIGTVAAQQLTGRRKITL